MLTICSDEGLTLESSALESVFGGQSTSSTQLIKPNYQLKFLSQIINRTPLLIFVLTLLPVSFIPESVRWLLKKGREDQARVILCNVAEVNGKEMPTESLELSQEEQNERLGDFRDLFVSRKMIHKTLCSWLMW